MAAEKYAQWLVDNEAKKGTPEFNTVAQAYKASRSSVDPAFASLENTQQKVKTEVAGQEATFTEAAGRGMMDVYEGGAQLGLNLALKMKGVEKIISEKTGSDKVGAAAANAIMMVTGFSELSRVSTPELESITNRLNKKIESDLMLFDKNNPDFSWGRLAGGVATPLTLIPGGKAATLSGKAVTGGVIGGTAAAFQPVKDTDAFFETKGLQVGAGVTFGSALPVATKLLSGVKNWLDELTKPLYKKGVYRDVAKFLRESITENREKITSALQRSISNKDGKTVGQIISEANKGTADDFGGLLVKLEKDLSRESDSLKSIYALQSSSRRAVIDGITGTEDDLARAISSRTKNATQNYGDAFGVSITGDSALTSFSKNKYFKTAMNTANDLAEANNVNPKENLTEFLHYVKIGLDKQLQKTGDDALANTERKAVGSIKGRLTTWIGEKNPLYEKARTEFQKDSVPINKMEVGRELKNALVNALENETPSTFSNAVRNAARTIKRSTGFSRFTKLEDIIPDEASAVRKIAKELAAEAKGKKMAEASKSVLSDLSAEVELRLPHILSRPVVVANHALKAISLDKSPEYKSLLIDLVKNPEKFLKAYKLPESSEKAKMAMDIVRKINTIAASQTIAKEQ